MIDPKQIRTTLRSAGEDDGIEVLEGMGEHYADIPASCLVEAVQSLVEERILHHLTAISAMNDGAELRILYHLWLGAGLTLRVHCSRDAPVLPSLSGMFTIAGWYEREVHDMFGIAFSGNPDLAPLLLPESWDGPPPLLDAEAEPCQS